MKMTLPLTFLQSIRPLMVISAVMAAGAIGYAQPRQDPGVVEYISSITQIQAQIPFTYSYPITIKSPSTLAAGVSVPVTFSTTVITKPGTVSDSLAKSYVTFSPAQVTYTGPGQSQTITVTFAVPAGGTSGAYGYQIFAAGWPVDPVLGLNNFGTSINATVTAAPTPVPPVVTIETPANGTTITVPSFPAQVQLRFNAAASSLYPITSVSASYGLSGQSGGVGIVLTTSNINTATATATGTMTISAAGRYVVTALGTNSVTTATAVNTFDIVIVQTPPPPTTGTVKGKIFFDVDGDGNFDADEIGLAGISVTLLTASGTPVAGVRSDTTDCSGNYSFSQIPAGTYKVRAANEFGMMISTANNVAATITTSAPSIGFKLDFSAIRNMRSDADSASYWKSRIDRDNDRCGSSSTDCYTRLIASSNFLLDGTMCFRGLTDSSAMSILGYNGSNALSQLRKELLAAEYNYASGAYLNDSCNNRTLTYLFLYYGEYVVKNSARFSNSDLLTAKDNFEDFNADRDRRSGCYH